MTQSGDAERRDQEAIAAARRPKSCGGCGRTFSSPSAYAVAHDGRCLPDHTIESQLVQVAGVWVSRGTDQAAG
jgi:hypothetical protein